MKIPLFGGTGEDRFDDVSYQKTQNFYPHINKDGKSQLVLYPTPGLTLFADVGIGNIRGAIKYGNEYYVVSNNKFYRVTASGSSVELGTLTTSGGRCSLAHNGANNGEQICIVDGADLYIWDSSASDFKVITDSGDPDYDADCPVGATHVVYMDTFFLINNPAFSGRFNKSAGYDGTNWDGLEFATAERDSDELRSHIVANRQLWLVGDDTAEVWFNSGGADFPFEPVQSGFSQWGTAAPFSLVEISGIVFWLSKNDEGQGIIVMATGMQPVAISSPEITTEISKFTTIDDAYGWAYQYQQHAFYVLTFPSEGKTFVYDILTQLWHEWNSKDLGIHRSTTHTFIYGKHLVGDPANGRIYELDWDENTDNGDTITRIRRSRSVHGDDKAIRHEAVMVDIKEGVTEIAEPKNSEVTSGSSDQYIANNILDASASFLGVVIPGDIYTEVSSGVSSVVVVVFTNTLGLVSTAGMNDSQPEPYTITGFRDVFRPAQILLRWRESNGAWSNQHSRSMGRPGETNKKVIWRRLGRSRDRVYEIMVTDPVPVVLIEGYARISPDSREIG